MVCKGFFMKRKIPATMITQHPDHGSRPYWHYKTFISTQYEAEEAYRSFAELGATEYKWDWEGKLVDESVLERLFSTYFEFFKKNPLGEKVFLTFRLPNPRIETEFRLGRAFMNMVSAASVAHHFGFIVPPLFEVILPMTETAEEMISLQEAFQELLHLKHPLFRMEHKLTKLYVIPLFEQVATITNSDTILREYVKRYKKKFGRKPPYVRPYVARSDPALNSGMVATVLAIKIALSRYKRLEKELEIPMYPIIGAGSLPFRGGLNPESVEQFAREYSGIKTTTLQSAFRYDYPQKDVRKAISFLEKQLPKQKPRTISQKDESELREIMSMFEKEYKDVIEGIAPVINKIASHIPQRRERFLHVGLFGYSRGNGKVRLPRAISFTAALYSLGVPPELIGTGRGIKIVKQKEQLSLFEKHYKYLREDLIRAGRYVNKELIHELAQKVPMWKEIEVDIQEVEKYLGQSLGPKTSDEKEHYQLSWKIYKALLKGKSLEYSIKQGAILRKSLG